MKTLLIGIVSLAVGVGGGAYVGGTRVKDVILAERALAEADSLAAASAAEMAGLGLGPDHVEGGVAVALGTDDHAGVGGDTDADPVEGGGPSGPETAEQSLQAGDSTQQQAVAIDDPQGPDETELVLAPQPVEPPQPDSAAILGAIKLAQIFSAMKPVDAAAVLQEMTDVEVEAILQHMQSRLAGQVLGEFAPERAALLSRVVLGGASGS